MVEANTRRALSMARNSTKHVRCTNGVLGGSYFGLLMGILGPLFTCVINTPVECISLSPVYWNHSNPIFKSSKNDHIVFVNPFDEIDFVCPYHAAPLSTTTETNHSAASSNAMEFYLIYQVSKSEYDECFIMSSVDSGSHRLLLSCTQPTQRRRFTIWFDPFQSVPRVPEYKPRHSYYFITTSTGHRSGLNNLLNGACALHNMKLTIRIGDIVDADDDVDDDDRTDDVTRNSDRIKNNERLRDDDDDDDDDDDNRRHHHHHQQQPQRQPHQDHNHHHHHHTGRPMFRHEKGLSLNSSSSSSSSSSFVYSRRNLSRHLSMLASSSRSSSDPLTSSAKQTTSGAPRDFMKDAVYDVSQKDRWIEAKESSRGEHRAVRLRQNTPEPTSSAAAEGSEAAAKSDAVAPSPLLLPLPPPLRALLATTRTTSLPFTNCIAFVIPLYATIIIITITMRSSFGLL